MVLQTLQDTHLCFLKAPNATAYKGRITLHGFPKHHVRVADPGSVNKALGYPELSQVTSTLHLWGAVLQSPRVAAGLSTRFSMEAGLVSMFHRRQCFSVKLSEKTLGKERTIIMIFKPLIIKTSHCRQTPIILFFFKRDSLSCIFVKSYESHFIFYKLKTLN